MKKIISFFLIFSVLLGTFSFTAFAKDELQFNNGKFKILVLSDTQDDESPSKKMLNIVSCAVKEADPDLIVFTGDFVEDSRFGDSLDDGAPFKEGVVVKKGGEVDKEKTLENIKTAVAAVLEIFEESGKPYAVALGNNDYKCSIGGEEWLEILSGYSGCIIEDKSDDPDNRLDYNLIIKNSQGNDFFNIFLMDTGRGGVNEEQIAWFKAESEKIKEENGGESLPAIVFQHIHLSDIGNLFEKCSPFDEGAGFVNGKCYRLKSGKMGVNNYTYEPGSSTEEFAAFKEEGNVLAAYFGHQHVDSFEGEVDGITLGFTYGCETAKPGPYGYRLITLNESDIENFTSEVYTVKSVSSDGSVTFQKQECSEYREYENIFEKAFYGVVNLFNCLKRGVISLLS